MRNGFNAALATGMVSTMVVLGGCTSDKPTEYGRERPPVDQVDPRDRGLQSYDVVSAADKMAMDLLALPELNASRTQWTIVVDHMDDMTTDRNFRHNYDIFLEELRTKLFKQGHGRVRLIENRQKFNDLRNKEREGPADDFGQGEGGQPAAPQAIQPDYALYGKVMDLPNRGTNFYMLEFSLSNLKTREQSWTGEYSVRTAR